MTMKRTDLEALAARHNVRIDGLDDVMAARFVLAKVPGTDPNGSPAYLESALAALATKPGVARRDAERVVRLDGEPSAKAARDAMLRDAESAWRQPLAARVDDGADGREEATRVDSRASLEQLQAATAAARRRAREDTEAEWQKPLGSSSTLVGA